MLGPASVLMNDHSCGAPGRSVHQASRSAVPQRICFCKLSDGLAALDGLIEVPASHPDLQGWHWSGHDILDLIATAEACKQPVTCDWLSTRHHHSYQVQTAAKSKALDVTNEPELQGGARLPGVLHKWVMGDTAKWHEGVNK